MNALTLSEAITKLELATEALRNAEERATSGQLALEMIHEIKNPLEALGHLTYLACEEADDHHKVREYLSLAEEQMSNLNHIVSQTLGFARSPNTIKPADLVIVAEAAVRIHQRTIDSRNVRLTKELPEKLVAQVYTGELLHVISNLIANALDALPADGSLRLRLKKDRNEVHVLIADNGEGIHPRHMEAIFQPFYTTKGTAGSGLGLALAKRIVDRHQGRIRVRSSVHPQKSGTIFKISFPLSRAEASAA